MGNDWEKTLTTDTHTGRYITYTISSVSAAAKLNTN